MLSVVVVSVVVLCGVVVLSVAGSPLWLLSAVVISVLHFLELCYLLWCLLLLYFWSCGTSGGAFCCCSVHCGALCCCGASAVVISGCCTFLSCATSGTRCCCAFWSCGNGGGTF